MNGRGCIAGGSWKTGWRNNGWKRPGWAAGADLCIDLVSRNAFSVDDAGRIEPWSRGGREKLGKIVPERKPSSGGQDYLRRAILHYINNLPFPRPSSFTPQLSSIPTAIVANSCPQHPPLLLPQSRQGPKALLNNPQPKSLPLSNSHP